jgi:hypothetical protein
MVVPLYGVVASNTTHKTVESTHLATLNRCFTLKKRYFAHGCGRQRPTTAAKNPVILSKNNILPQKSPVNPVQKITVQTK